MRRSLLVLFVVCHATPLFAQSFKVVSFNTLHLGWGGDQKTAAKCLAARDALTSANADVLVLQEVMPKFAACPSPVTTYEWVISDNQFGSSRYAERYLILLRKTTFPTIGKKLEFPKLSAFSRPPMAVPVIPQKSTATYYIADYHAIWGRSKGQRTAEAKAICSTWVPLLKTEGVALAGDWNLTASEVMANGKCMSAAGPADATTLNRSGSDYSSSYDHAVQFGKGGGLTLQSSARMPPINTANWRKTTSDHVPIQATYTYQ